MMKEWLEIIWVKIGLFLAGAAIIHFILSRIYRRLQPRLAKTHFVWDEALLKAVYPPLSLTIWGIALLLITELFVPISHAFLPFRIGLVLVVLWVLLRFITNWELSSLQAHHGRLKKYDKTTVRAVCQLMRIAAFIIAILIALQTSGISISAVLAFGGAGGIVVGLAAKDLLANFFGGLMIYLDRPFSIGDWIRSPEKEIEGTVEAIGWRLTRIRTFDRHPLYVPNAAFSTITVENPSRMTNRRIVTTIGVPYESAPKIKEITQSIREMLENHPEVDQSASVFVNFTDFGASSLDIYFSVYTKTVDRTAYMKAREEILLKVIETLGAHGTTLAYPTRKIRSE